MLLPATLHVRPRHVRGFVNTWLRRLQLHPPRQLAALGLATCNLPRICSQLYPTVAAGACLGSSVSVAAVCGYLLPSVAMHCMERSSRATFAAGLVAHAAAAAAQHAD